MHDKEGYITFFKIIIHLFIKTYIFLDAPIHIPTIFFSPKENQKVM